MSKGYAAVRWTEGEDEYKPVSVDTWPVREHKDEGDGVLSHPACVVVSMDLGDEEQAQVVFTRADLMSMLTRVNEANL